MAAAKRLTPAERAAELRRRWEAAVAAVTPEALADGHEHQLGVLRCVVAGEKLSIILMTSRRAAKSTTACQALLLTAMRSPWGGLGVSCLYIGLTRGPAKKVWRKIFKPMLRKFKVPASHSEIDSTTTLANGSTIQFLGSDDERNIQTLLGDSMAGGMAVLDELQSDPGLAAMLAIDIIEPMLSEATAAQPKPGVMMLCGTVPPAPAGFFWDTWVANFDEETQATRPDSTWYCGAWSRFDNPHTHRNRELLDAYLFRYKLDESALRVRKDWFGERVFDTAGTCFGYRKTVNGIVGVIAPWSAGLELKPGKMIATLPPPGVDTFAAGLDCGGTDRTAAILWGWSRRHEPLGVFQIAEWVTDRDTPVTSSQYLAVLRLWKERYGNIVRTIRDDGSSATIDDVLRLENGIIIEPPDKGKGSLKARVDRLADLLACARAWIILGSELEKDLERTRWDAAALARGQFKFASAWHPDPADAATYGIVAYVEPPQPKKAKKAGSENEQAALDAAAAMKERFRPQPKGARFKAASTLWR